MTARSAVVVAGGGPLRSAAAAAGQAAVAAGAVVVAADGGVAAALDAGLPVHHAVGDFDSLPAVVLEDVAAGGAEVQRYPPEKDATDLELALELAAGLVAGQGGARLLVLGAWGDRFDHLLGEVALLASDRWRGIEVEAWLDGANLHVVRSECRLQGVPGELVSLLPVGGPARGIRTGGLRYPLHDEELLPDTTRGVSNELVAAGATITLREGVLLVVRPFTGRRGEPGRVG